MRDTLSIVSSSDVVIWARKAAERHLEPLGRRWVHVQSVASMAAKVGFAFGGDDGETLVAAALLHDIGYAPSLARTKFHPLDGARFVRAAGHEALARLVAHHSGARVEASLRGLDDYLVEFPFGDTPLDQALTYCDLTTGPDGTPCSLNERVEEIVDRYGAEHVVARAIIASWPEFRRAVADTEGRLAEAGVSPSR